MLELTPVHDLGRVERMLALRAFPGWHALRAPEVAAAASIARPLRARAGAVLVPADGPVEHVFMIVRGELVVKRDGKVLGHFRDGASVGGLAAFSGQHEGYEVSAVTEATLMVIEVAELEELFEDRFPILSRVLRELAREMLELRLALPNAGFPSEAPMGESCPARPLDLVERIFYLRNNLSTDNATIDSIAVLAKTAQEIRRAPGELLWKVGDPSTSMIAILCGRVRGTSPEGHVFELGAGDLAGTLGSTAELPRWYECEVVDGIVALSLSRDVTLDVWEDHPELPLRLLRVFSAATLALLERRAR